MDAAILQRCQELEQSLGLCWQQRQTNADFWTCKAALRAAVATWQTQIQPALQDHRQGATAAGAAPEDAAALKLLQTLVQAALDMKDELTAGALLDQAVELAHATGQEAVQREFMEKCTGLPGAGPRRGPWGKR